MTKPKPTQQQEAFFTGCLTTNSHITLSARAGTGKTFSLVEAAQRMTKANVMGDGLAVAFNKIIAQELGDRMPASMETSTMHSLGLRLLKANQPNIRFKVDGRKTFGCIDNLLKIEWEDKAKVARVVDMLRLNLVDESMWETSAEIFLEENGYESHWAELCAATLNESNTQIANGIVDFVDMLYGPWLHKLRPNRSFDTIFTDEAQDMNSLQRWLIRRHLKATGRMIICGDPRQAIMGFAGATASSMKEFEALFKSDFKQYEISTTFRCGHNIVAAAKQAIGPTNDLDNYFALEGMHDGHVSVLDADREPEEFIEGDAIICRTNAPLLEMAIWFLSNDKGFKLAGKDFLRQLKSRMCRGLKNSQPTAAARRQVEDWLQDRVDYAQQVGRPNLADRHRDVAQCCMVFLNLKGINTVGDIKDKIDSLETDQMGPVLSSIHKAKGLEWSRVYWLGHATHLNQMAKRKELEDPNSQEWNLRYVCATRAKDTLHLLDEVDLGNNEETN